MAPGEQEITNVYIFVSDALRWDHLPDTVREVGTTKKTIAQSTLSPSGFASIFTGQYPSTHGVYTFSDTIDTDASLFGLEAYDVSIWQEYGDAIFRVLGQEPAAAGSIGLERASPPFIHVERELATHAPFRTTVDSATWTESDALAYLNDESADIATLRQSYARAAETAAQRFQLRLDYLDDRGLLDETLVIFTADHGELLGEYTEFSHTYPVVPELVTVPTVFFHPNDRPVTADVLSQVDFAPTIADVLGVDLGYPVDGTSAYGDEVREYGISQLHLPAGSSARGPVDTSLSNVFHRSAYTVNSVWDSGGGWVFNDSTRLARLSYLVKALLPSQRKRNAIRQDPAAVRDLVKAIGKRDIRYGEPNLTREEAREALAGREPKADPASEPSNLSDSQVEHLQDLGYL